MEYDFKRIDLLTRNILIFHSFILNNGIKFRIQKFKKQKWMN